MEELYTGLLVPEGDGRRLSNSRDKLIIKYLYIMRFEY